jgi:hypothetical protein
MTSDDEQEPSVRAQLTAALKECERQIEILEHPPRIGSNNSREIAMLRVELRRLRAALDNLDDGN